MKKSRNILLNGLLLIVVFSLTVRAVFSGEDIGEVWEYLQQANPVYVISGIACVFLFIIGEAAIIRYLLRTLGTCTRFVRCCLYSFIGFFYSCITPSASGGQPMQVIAMSKDKIPVPVSSVVLAIVTITYKLVLVVIGLLVMLLRPESVMAYMEGVDGLVYLGMALNVGCIALLLMLVFQPGIVRKCAEALIDFLIRRHLLKNSQKMLDRLNRMMNQYTGTAEYYASHHGVIVKVFFATMAQRIMLFLVTWFAYKALGLSGQRLVVIVTLQAMISVVSDMMPLPGGMGVSETLFLQLFLPVFGSELVLPGLMLSRGIGYYGQLAISAVMMVTASLVLRRRD